MVQVTARLPGRDLLESGTLVLGPHTNEVTVHIADLGFQFRFETDTGPPRIEPKLIHPKLILYVFHNFDNPLGVAWNIDSLANVEGSPIGLDLIVYAISSDAGKTTRSLNYTFWKGPRV